jgi:ABC-type multidrug transport system fused ATPase/permease subunit
MSGKNAAVFGLYPDETESCGRRARLRNFKGRIEFVKVSFNYQADRPVLTNVSFKIEPGQVAALVGPTGAGKTSINLIPRFYDPSSGLVKIDGYDVRSFKQKSLRQADTAGASLFRLFQ